MTGKNDWENSINNCRTSHSCRAAVVPDSLWVAPVAHAVHSCRTPHNCRTSHSCRVASSMRSHQRSTRRADRSSMRTGSRPGSTCDPAEFKFF
eukprot:COSAG02_NODE_148_length_33809_cov_158.369594_25_plen_93_part_00